MVAVPSPARPASRGASASWWRYVERGRSHEVLAEWRERDGRLQLCEREPGGSARFDRVWESLQPWEARLELWSLEARLADLGEYWRARSEAPGWARVRRPAGAPRADPRPNAVLSGPDARFVHHYHGARGEGDTLLAALRVADPRRLTVVQARLDVPSLDVGRIEMLHEGLPDVLSRSLVLREQVALSSSGLAKLTSGDDYRRAFGPTGETRAARLVEDILARVRAGQWDGPVDRPEDSDTYAEFLVTLHDPRLVALHRRFLEPGEEEILLAGGPVAIRRAVTTKRARAPHSAQHLLTILEASLLARERMQAGRLRRSDPEVRALARLAYYL